jgi:hypothetical protein
LGREATCIADSAAADRSCEEEEEAIGDEESAHEAESAHGDTEMRFSLFHRVGE